ncbi:DUF3631 domain-containing protein [Bradyrhizobium sp. Gha]|uniref:DUF3631 domain-containing protein n=1 Tax=Bradyrhizobium sp. Gha TaxID=1855318 RepID=UPI0008F331D1|nr:DUF3631 domain-containing protein [Bradyrhizobium sp. Gha]SFJ71857.1 Protein of unknown function [Bradyrhizobium sp. Gha]
MTGHKAIAQHFGDRERQLIDKLFRALATDNTHEAEAARGRIDSLLRDYKKTWADIIQLLGGAANAIRAELARDIVALGASDADERAKARRNIFDLLAGHRKSWNDLVDVLCSNSHAAWACDPSADAPQRVNPLALVHHLLQEYVALQPHEYVVVALWALHTHICDRFMVTPRLALRSPVPDCGKTTLLDILARLTTRPEKFDSVTTAALYRVIDAAHPTLLIDEADNLGLALRDNGRLRAIFNSGHRKGGTVAIMERGRVRKFSTFAPLALALPDTFGALPRTLNSRCITIAMERHDGQRKLKRFDASHPDPALDAAYMQILLWREVKLDPDPAMPVHNRWADNWRPLISIADALGWGEQARDAMLIFAREYHDADIKILLLADIRKVFDIRNVDYLPTKILLDALHNLDEADWCEFRGVRSDQRPHKLKDTELASMLREFKIKPKTIWSEGTSAKGYRRAWFEEPWRAYCDTTGSQPSNATGLRVVRDGTP